MENPEKINKAQKDITRATNLPEGDVALVFDEIAQHIVKQLEAGEAAVFPFGTFSFEEHATRNGKKQLRFRARGYLKGELQNRLYIK